MFALLSPYLMAGDADSPPKTAIAIAVLTKRDAAMKKALDAYNLAVIRANKQASQDADSAIRRAMSSQDLDAVNELTAIKKMTADQTDATPRPNELLGKWQIGEGIWTITQTRATHPGSEGSQVLEWRDNGLLVKWADGAKDRLNFINANIVLQEGFSPANSSHFPDGMPDSYFVGQKIK